MKYSEKFDEEEITQKEDKISNINDNVTNYEENQNTLFNKNNINYFIKYKNIRKIYLYFFW